jgi:Flp pilus assembly protein CpaB
MATTTVDDAKSSRRLAASRGTVVAPRPPGQRRNRAAVFLGFLLIVGFGLGGAVLYAAAGGRQSVLAMAREVPAGARIGDQDLRVVQVAADSSLTPVPASARSQVVGRLARVGLVPGTLLTPAHLAPKGEGPPAGQSVVALLLTFGQAPALSPGDRVLVVAPAQNLSVSAQVFSVDRRSQSSDDVRVSLLADDANAGRIASIAAAKGEISIVLRPSGQ